MRPTNDGESEIMASKLPAIMLYTGDWKKDPCLSKCGPATRGIWWDILCAMHDDNRSGILTGTPLELARICRCNVAQLNRASNELKRTKTADVTFCNGEITFCNRRMKREADGRESTKMRVKKHREKKPKHLCNAPSSYSSSISVTKENKEGVFLFGLFWKLYPCKKDKKDAKDIWVKNKCHEHFDAIMAAVKKQVKDYNYKKSEGGFVENFPYAVRWLRREKWKDEPTKTKDGYIISERKELGHE